MCFAGTSAWLRELLKQWCGAQTLGLLPRSYVRLTRTLFFFFFSFLLQPPGSSPVNLVSLDFPHWKSQSTEKRNLVKHIHQCCPRGFIAQSQYFNQAASITQVRSITIRLRSTQRTPPPPFPLPFFLNAERAGIPSLHPKKKKGEEVRGQTRIPPYLSSHPVPSHQQIFG